MSNLPRLRSMTGADLLALVNDKKEVPLVCLFSLFPIDKWIRDGDSVVRFSCPVECTAPHPPVKIVLPVIYDNTWSEIQTFTMPKEPVVRLVEKRFGTRLVTIGEELSHRELVAYWVREIRSVRESQSPWG